MATTPRSQPVNARTVVLLQASAQKKLRRLAHKENVSAGEIIRRSLDSYEGLATRIRREQEDALVAATLAELEQALASANQSMQQTCRRLDQLTAQLSASHSR